MSPQEAADLIDPEVVALVDAYEMALAINDNEVLDRNAQCRALEASRQLRADVRLLDCDGRGHVVIQVQNAAPVPTLSRGCYAFQTPGRFNLTRRAYDAYRAANPGLDYVTDF